jgi:hypothetical protein
MAVRAAGDQSLESSADPQLIDSATGLSLITRFNKSTQPF